jgi:hypothetical protein
MMDALYDNADGPADAKFAVGIPHGALLQVAPRLGVARELPLIESGSLLQHGSRVRRSAWLLQVSGGLAQSAALRFGESPACPSAYTVQSRVIVLSEMTICHR